MASNEPYRVVIVDDHTLMRNGLEAMLEIEPEYDVVGVAADGRAAIRLATELNPDIMVIDLSMPRTSGIDAIVQVKRQRPEVKIIALTFHKEDKYIHATLAAGADGYVLKDDSRDELMAALKSVMGGNTYLSPTISGKVVAGYLSGNDVVSQEPSWAILTQRERQVIKLIAEGKRTKEIAAYLSLSPKTVEKHRTNLMKKLDLHSVSEVTVYAIQNGLTSG